MRNQASNPNKSSKQTSLNKYQKFTGMSSRGSKKQVSIDALSKGSKTSIKSFTDISIKPSINKIAKSHKYLKPTNPPQTQRNKAYSKQKILLDSFSILQDLVKQMGRMIQRIRTQIQRTVDNTVRQLKKDITAFMYKKTNNNQHIKQLQQLFIQQNHTRIKNNTKVIRTQSLTTSEEPTTQKNPSNINRKNPFTNPLKLRNELIHAENRGFGSKQQQEIEIKKYNAQKYTKNNDDSFQGMAQNRNRSRSRSISQKFKGLQKHIGSLRNMLDKGQKSEQNQ